MILFGKYLCLKGITIYKLEIQAVSLIYKSIMKLLEKEKFQINSFIYHIFLIKDSMCQNIKNEIVDFIHERIYKIIRM